MRLPYLAPLIIASAASAQFSDCNNNQIPDSDDIAQGTSEDCNGNGVPDECEVNAAAGEVIAHAKISDTTGGLAAALEDGDGFGWTSATIDDLDGDGIRELAVSAPRHDDGGTNRGAVWILFLNADGSIRTEQKISQTSGGFTGSLQDEAHFGAGISSVGDIDGDGHGDIAVGAPGAASWEGELWILSLHPDGTVKSTLQIAQGVNGFTGSLNPGDEFGGAVTSIGDLDGDGVIDLAVGAPLDDDGDTNRGAVWILFLDAGGAVASHQKISQTTGGFSGTLDVRAHFGDSLSSMGDHDGDGVVDLAVGAHQEYGWGDRLGAAWILFLEPDGTVKSHQEITQNVGGFAENLDNNAHFGTSVTSLGDIDEDGVGDLLCGAVYQGSDGAAWILFLHPDGTVRDSLKIEEGAGGFDGDLDPGGNFGSSGAFLGDMSGDGVLRLAVGADRDDDGGTGRGSVWLLSLAHLSDGNGNGVIDACECDMVNFCQTSPNTAGAGALMTWTGIPSLSQNTFTLGANGVAPGEPGVFYFGDFAQDPPIPFGNGYRCAGGNTVRLNPPVFADATGIATRAVDLQSPPLDFFAPGDTAYFQFWYRDHPQVGETFNLSDGLAVTFCQ